MNKTDPILIAGAGIGGLTAAVAFARRGFAVSVLESQAAPREAGAGIQLGPNAVLALRQIGLDIAHNPSVARPEAVRVRQFNGAELANFPLGNWISHRHGAAYLTLHRADLHAFLYEAAANESNIEIRHGFRLSELENGDSAVTAISSDGDRQSGCLLVGADGLWSAVRPLLFGSKVPHFSGKTAWRTVIPVAAATGAFAENAVGLWLGPSGHLVHYPVRGGSEVNLVAVIDDPWRNDGWNSSADVAELLPSFAGWHESLPTTLADAAQWRRWTLMERPDLAHWARGRCVLIGDAAHPVLPFLAQGGVLAIEDAVALANLCEDQQLSDSVVVSAALQRFQQARMPRAKRVQASSRRNGRIYHLDGPMAKARNLALAARSGVAFMRDLDWLYGYHVR